MLGQKSLFEKAKEIIKLSDNIVFFGGAGVSTASGVPDFRSENGIYSQKRGGRSPEYYLSHDYYLDDPKGFSELIREMYGWSAVKPNEAHYALAKLEKEGKLKAVVTQNIDGLHQKAGSKAVYEIHGNLEDYYCGNCHVNAPKEDFLNADGVCRCKHCGGVVRPDVVLYGEGLNMDTYYKAIDAIQNADVFIVGGSSLVVYPAAGLLNYYHGKKLILINREETLADYKANYSIYGDISEILPALIY